MNPLVCQPFLLLPARACLKKSMQYSHYSVSLPSRYTSRHTRLIAANLNWYHPLVITPFKRALESLRYVMFCLPDLWHPTRWNTFWGGCARLVTANTESSCAAVASVENRFLLCQVRSRHPDSHYFFPQFLFIYNGIYPMFIILFFAELEKCRLTRPCISLQ